VIAMLRPCCIAEDILKDVMEITTFCPKQKKQKNKKPIKQPNNQTVVLFTSHERMKKYESSHLTGGTVSTVELLSFLHTVHIPFGIAAIYISPVII
jgi:hypothetical protein